jgi:hypothetical protein
MPRTCPDCGTSVEYSTRTAYVLNGSCGQCGLVLTVLEDAPGTPSGAPPVGTTIGSSPRGSASRGNEPPCPACGAPLGFHASSSGGIEGTCTGCGASSEYVPAGSAAREDAPMRGRRPERPSFSGGGGGGSFPSQARPCRECGGPLRFSTTPDGTVAGECGSCGNKFVLPPRRDGDGGGRGGGGRRFDRGSGPRFGGGGGRRDGPPRYGRPPGGPGRFRPREDRGGDSDEERPRRRPRRE